MRESRLFSSMSSYVRTNAASIFRIYTQYEPLRVFLAAAAIVGLVALIVWGRFAFLFVTGHGQGHVQSVVLGSMLFVVAVQLAALGVIGDLLAANRVLIQRALERTRRIELKLGVEPSHYERGERRDGPRVEPVAGPTAVAPADGSHSDPVAGVPADGGHSVPLGGDR
jgi:hypothetical protein